MSELVKLRGHLATEQSKEQQLDVLCSSDIISVRDILDPYEDDVTKLNTGQASACMSRLHANVTALSECRARIARLKKELGL